LLRLLVKLMLLLSWMLQFQLSVCGQADSVVTVLLRGKAVDAENPTRSLQDLMIINATTQHGFFGNADGSFIMPVNKTDTIIIASTGYSSLKICLADSLFKEQYFFYARLPKLSVRLKEVSIIAPRDLDAIQADIARLGYRKEDYMLSGIDPLQSPITFLYQQFSRFEQLRRRNAERINDDKRRNLLKELLANFVAADIIQLDDQSFDDFIDYAQVPEELMQSLTQYEFCIYIKKKYQLYSYVRDKRSQRNRNPVDYYQER
jgi:hypothetical protein